MNKIARGVGAVANNPLTQTLVGSLAPEFAPALGMVGQVARGVRSATGGGGYSGGKIAGKKMKRLSRR